MQSGQWAGVAVLTGTTAPPESCLTVFSYLIRALTEPSTVAAQQPGASLTALCLVTHGVQGSAVDGERAVRLSALLALARSGAPLGPTTPPIDRRADGGGVGPGPAPWPLGQLG